jgi:hypothetical protein
MSKGGGVGMSMLIVSEDEKYVYPLQGLKRVELKKGMNITRFIRDYNKTGVNADVGIINKKKGHKVKWIEVPYNFETNQKYQGGGAVRIPTMLYKNELGKYFPQHVRQELDDMFGRQGPAPLTVTGLNDKTYIAEKVYDRNDDERIKLKVVKTEKKAKGGPVESEYVEIFATVSKKTDNWKDRKEKLMDLSIDDSNYAIRKDYPTIFNVNTRIKSTDLEKAKKLSDDFYHVPAEAYAKGGNIVAISKITSVQKEVDAGNVTYRGGAGGTRIKVKGKEYLISNDDFNKLGGIKKMNFKAPFRKSYKTGGEVGIGSYVSYHKGDEVRQGFIVDEIDANNFEIHSSKPFAQSLIKKDKVIGHVEQKRKFKLFDKGGTVHPESALGSIDEILAGTKNVKLDNGDIYKAVKRLRAPALAKGMVVLAYYDAGNAGSDLYEILGFTGDEEKYGEGGVKFDTAKEVYKNYGVKNLDTLEKHQDKNGHGYSTYLTVKDLNRDESGPWFYAFQGRWSRGSGAEPLSFILMEKIASSKPKASSKTLSMSNLTETIFSIYDSYNDYSREGIEAGHSQDGLTFETSPRKDDSTPSYVDRDSPLRITTSDFLTKQSELHDELKWEFDGNILRIWIEQLHPGVPNRVPQNLIDEDIIRDSELIDRLDDIDYTFDDQIGHEDGTAFYEMELDGKKYLLAEDDNANRVWYYAGEGTDEWKEKLDHLIKNIKQGIGWIDPQYVDASFSQTLPDLDYNWDEEVATKVFTALIDADLLYQESHTAGGQSEEKGEEVEDVEEALILAGLKNRSTSAPEPAVSFTSNIDSAWEDNLIARNDIKTLLIRAYEIGGEDLQWDLVNSILDGVCEASEYIIDKDGEHAVNGQTDIKTRLERAVACIDKKIKS